MTRNVFDRVFEFDSTPDSSGLIQVNENYGGANNLSYTVLGEYVGGADILIYRKDDYDAGKITNEYALNAVRQDPEGRWSHSVYLDVGDYILKCYKAKVAGPDIYLLSVTE